MPSYQNVQIAPSISAADFTRLGDQIQEAQNAGSDLLHIDVMDGRFVPNITLGPAAVAAIRRVTDLPLDVHLMIVEPHHFIEAFARAGADLITVHVEENPNLYRTVQLIRDQGCKAGVAINPHTPVEMLREIIMLVDVVNVMTVNPGFGGQEFLMPMKSKIASLKAMIGEIRREVDIEVDGGITSETAIHAVQAGANILVAGTAVFANPDGIASGISSLRDGLEGDS